MNPNLTFSLIQSDLFWENKSENLRQFTQKINSLPQGQNIVILPETFNTGFSTNTQNIIEHVDSITFQWMKEISQKNKIILIGSYFVEEHGKNFNRLIWMQPNGQYGFYNKRHLFSFGGEHQNFSAGEKKFIAQVNGWKINTIICYDLRFPTWIRQSKQDPYDVLLCIANWPSKRSDAWRTLLRARAIENQCYVIAVNRIGIDGNGLHYQGNSCVIDPLGKTLFESEDEEIIKTISLDKNYLQDVRAQFQFLQDADDFAIF